MSKFSLSLDLGFWQFFFCTGKYYIIELGDHQHYRLTEAIAEKSIQRSSETNYKPNFLKVLDILFEQQ